LKPPFFGAAGANLRHRRVFALSIVTCAAFLSWMRRAVREVN
jgi:hypothetical protein